MKDDRGTHTDGNHGGPNRTDSEVRSWKTNIRDLFAIDPRSLAVFRMAMGALLLVDLAIRVTDRIR